MVVALVAWYIAAVGWLGTSFELDVSVLAKLQGIGIPLLTGLITKKVASSRVKALCTALLSLVGTVVAVAIAADGKIVLGDYIDTFVTTLVTAVATYYGLWKPTGAAEAVQDIAPDKGIGTEPEVMTNLADHFDILPGNAFDDAPGNAVVAPRVGERPPLAPHVDVLSAAEVRSHKLFMLLEETKETLYKRAMKLPIHAKVNTRTTKRELAELILAYEGEVKPFPQ